MPKIVTIGGGSGQYGILTGLKRNDKVKQEDISAIVTTFDSGGNTGLLLEARKPKDVKGNYLPIGDIRQCLAALANRPIEMFQYRIKEGENKGAVVGNVILDALFEMHKNDFQKAIEEARKEYDVRGNVYPCTLTRGHFYGVLRDGHKIDGENMLVEMSMFYESPVEKIAIEPSDLEANLEAVQALLTADKIILSQGSLYTSLLPNIAVKGISEAIRKSSAKKVYIMNIVTQRGETDRFTAKRHVDEIEKYLGEGTIDRVVLHSGELPQGLEAKYAREMQQRVVDDLGNHGRVIRGELIAKDSPVLRHDPDKLAEIILGLL